MIRKYLVIGKRVSLASSRRDSINSVVPPLEILMPVDVFWQIEEHLKRYDLMASSGEESAILSEITKTILKLVTPYAVTEKERLWLYANSESAE